jgi:hypothetical protein
VAPYKITNEEALGHDIVRQSQDAGADGFELNFVVGVDLDRFAPYPIVDGQGFTAATAAPP